MRYIWVFSEIIISQRNGLFFTNFIYSTTYYDNNVCEYAKSLKPSARGELEIIDLNNIYLKEGKLDVISLGRGYGWLDTGTVDSLYEASEYVRVLENRQGLKISCLEEISYKNGWINKESLIESAYLYGKVHMENI